MKVTPPGSKKTRRINVVVAFVVSLFVFIWHSVVNVTVLPWLEGSVQGVTHVGLFSLLTAAGLGMYFCCVFTDPGRVPSGWLPDTESAAFVEVKKKGGEARYCQKCKEYKPPRTHHCRHCDRCILRMDHHCSWVNNCIGHANYKAFLLFLFYSIAALLYGLVLMVARGLSNTDASVTLRQEARQAARERAGEQPLLDAAAASSLVQVAAIILSILLVLALGVLLGWHVYLVASNKTTVEHHEGVRAKRTAHADTYRRGEWQPGKHIYDVGLYGNVRAVLGHPLHWLVPGRKVSEDGCSFATV